MTIDEWWGVAGAVTFVFVVVRQRFAPLFADGYGSWRFWVGATMCGVLWHVFWAAAAFGVGVESRNTKEGA